MQPPFLELAFYVGQRGVRGAFNSLSPPSIFGAELPQETRIVGGCVVIRTEGEAFCGSMRDDTARLRSLGAKAYAAFVSTAEQIDCVYGAILVEYTLEEPAELREDLRSLAFQNFYLSRRLLPAALASTVLSMMPSNAFVEERKHGIYISTSSEFNPRGAEVADRSEAQVFSTKVAREIGKAIV